MKQTTIAISPSVKKLLLCVKHDMEDKDQKSHSYSDVIEYLYQMYAIHSDA